MLRVLKKEERKKHIMEFFQSTFFEKKSERDAANPSSTGKLLQTPSSRRVSVDTRDFQRSTHTKRPIKDLKDSSHTPNTPPPISFRSQVTVQKITTCILYDV